MLYIVGAIFAVLLNWLGVPCLAFSLGMFIPLQLNTPVLIGGLISWFVSSRSKDAEVNKARQEHGTLIASGFIAGGALLGVVSAGMRFAGFEYVCPWGGDEALMQSLGLAVYVLLIAWFAWTCIKAKKNA